MDDSMNSVHSISAMDISPASSPTTTYHPAPLNSSVLTAFQHQQQLISNMLFSAPKDLDQSTMQPTDERPRLLNSTYQEMKLNTLSDETNQLRQRIVTDPLASVPEPSPIPKQIDSNSSRQSFSKVLMVLMIVLLGLYLCVFYRSKPVPMPRATTLQNVTDYLVEHLVGQDQGLKEFVDALEKHKNFSMVLIEGPVGVGKTYLASSIEKFIPTSLLSIDTLLGLSPHHWTEPETLAFYLASHFTHSDFQFLILDDLDLLPANGHHCQSLITALQSLSVNRNLFILLLQTKELSKSCQQQFSDVLTRSIHFQSLTRDHVRHCIKREAYLQNVQSSFTNEQVENVLNSIAFFHNQDVAYATTGCKQVSSLVMFESRKHSH